MLALESRRAELIRFLCRKSAWWSGLEVELMNFRGGEFRGGDFCKDTIFFKLQQLKLKFFCIFAVTRRDHSVSLTFMNNTNNLNDSCFISVLKAIPEIPFWNVLF
jgi:hypothetical protein